MTNSPTILIVEDQPGELEALARCLRADDYEVITAPDMQSALAHIERNPDLVLSDVRLGAANGIDLLRTWRQRDPETPFILITAFGDIAGAVEAVKAGAEDYLVKPVSPALLLNRIAQCLLAPHNGSSMGGSHMSNGRERVSVPLEQLEREAIEQALEDHQGNRTHAAQALGISVRTLQRKLKAWNAAAAL